MNYDLVFQTKQGPIFSYHILIIFFFFCKKLTFDSLRASLKTGFKNKWWVCFEPSCSVAAELQKKCANNMADSEPCTKYRDFGT